MTGVLVVTGGGRDIGAAVCRLAASRGYPVVINYVSDEAAAAGVRADIEAAGGTAVAVAGDVADEGDVRRVFAAADELGELTGVVSNAGITGGQQGGGRLAHPRAGAGGGRRRRPGQRGRTRPRAPGPARRRPACRTGWRSAPR